MSLDGMGNPFIKVPREESENQTKVSMMLRSGQNSFEGLDLH